MDKHPSVVCHYRGQLSSDLLIKGLMSHTIHLQAEKLTIIAE